MESVKDVNVLVVGAGGIGCELLKNLVLSGFNKIEVIDLDTIELSNLNRQFLFQKCHVGKPKAIIARESVLKYNPNADIKAYHDSVMKVEFGVDYFKQFAIVMNALDNKAARSHVNRLCLAADVPLIESGSSGYLGNVSFIRRGLTECYDCVPKPAAKTFPGCTIRNTPSEPIHCIVWAKHLFNQLFGSEDPDEAVSPDGEDPENMADAGKTAIEKKETDEAVTRQSTRQWAKETNYDSTKIFNKLFCDDIKYLLSMAKLWEKRKAPTPIDWQESINNSSMPIYPQSDQTNEQTGPNKLESHRILTIREYCEIFSDSVCNLKTRLETSTDSNPILVWDKDDEDALNFVTAASNLRCYIFSIGPKSKFETKSLAGSIIPAIATTNAIVAGLIVLQAFKVLKNKQDECKAVYLRDKPSTNNKLITGCVSFKPNEKCYVCATKPEITIKLNTETFTVKQFETKILKQELNMIQPDVEIDDGTGRIIISSEEGETEENNDKTLAHFGLADNSSLKCDDFFQNYQLKITIALCSKFDEQNTNNYEIVSQNQMLKDLQENLKKDKENTSNANNTVDTAPETPAEDKTSNKRQYETAFDEDESGKLTKKLKQTNNSDLSHQETNNEVQKNSSPNEEILVEDDDCLIGENSNQNPVAQDEDDDVIECSSEEDIIEINENGNSNSKLLNNGNNNSSLKRNGNHDQNQAGAKRKNSHQCAEISEKNDDSDEGITVIE